MGIIRNGLNTLGSLLKFDAIHVARSAAWLNARIAWSTLLTFCLSVALANFITPNQYGNYKFIIAAVTFWGTLFLTGASTAVNRSVARGNEQVFLDSIPLQLKWDLVGALGIAITGAYYTAHSNVAVGIPILISAIIYPIASTLNTYIALYAGRQDFKHQALFESLTTTVYVIFVLGGLLLGANAGLLAVLFFLSNAIGHGIGFWRARQTVAHNAITDTESLTYAKQLSLVSVPAGFMLQLDNILVFHYLGSTELAVYTFSMLGPDKISGLLKTFPPIAFPRFARRTMRQLQGGVMLRAVQLSITAGVVALVYALFAPVVFRLLFPQYLAAIPYTRVYALSLLAAGASLPLMSLYAQRRIRRIATLLIGLPALQLVATFLGIRYFGLWGAIGAKLGMDFINFSATSVIHQYRQKLPNHA